MHGLRDRYGFAFSIGNACACTQALRRAGMQYLSFPLDWAGTGSIVKNANLIVNGFEGFLDKSAYRYCNPTPDAPYDIYHNEKVGIYFSHDFPRAVPLDTCWPKVEDRFRRRISRFMQVMEESGDILALYVELPSDPRITLSELETTRDVLQGRFGRSRVDVLCVSPESGKAFSAGDVRAVADRIYKVGFDYVSAGCACGNIDAKRVAAALVQLVSGVTDYRTASEKAKYRQVKRQKMMELYKAANIWELFRNKTYYKLMKHFQNRLERLGFDFGNG